MTCKNVFFLRFFVLPFSEKAEKIKGHKCIGTQKNFFMDSTFLTKVPILQN